MNLPPPSASACCRKSHWPLTSAFGDRRNAVLVAGRESAGENAHIGTATLEDLDALVRIEQQCFEPEVAFSRRRLRYLVSSPATRAWVVREHGTVVASLTVIYLRTRRGLLGRLYSLSVSPAHRGRGYARKLLQTCLHQLRRDGAYAAVLEVRTDNAQAIRLYEQEGFRRTRLLRDYYAPSQHALKLRADLADG